MSFVIRPAGLADIPGIARVIQQSLGDEPNEAQIVGALRERDHITIVAAENETIAGFASGFLTWCGRWRWELDLLGVLPDFQGRGLGRQLIQTCTETGHAMTINERDIVAQTARGLVAIHNIASQKAFAHAGYILLPQTCGVFVSLGNYPDYVPLLPENTHLIPVNTLTYRGFWIEGDISQQALQAAQAAKTGYGWYSTGAVVPLAHTHACQLLQANGFMMLGEFQWWLYEYKMAR